MAKSRKDGEGRTKKTGGSSALKEVRSVVTTINLHKRLHGVKFKGRAPRAVKEVRKFVQQQMGTRDVRIEQVVNQMIWSKGVKNVPFRIRVKMERRRNDDEDAVDRLFTLVSHVPVADFKKLQTINCTM